VTARLVTLCAAGIAVATTAIVCGRRGDHPAVPAPASPDAAATATAAAPPPQPRVAPALAIDPQFGPPHGDPPSDRAGDGRAGDAPDAAPAAREPTPAELATAATVRHLSDARAAYADGDFALALTHAERALERSAGGQARWIAALSACETGQVDRAQHHADHLDRRRFERVRDHCAGRAITLRHPYDPPADADL
jgi:hypothetical protein